MLHSHAASLAHGWRSPRQCPACLLLLTASLVASLGTVLPAAAEPLPQSQLMAQRIVDGLPPPPVGSDRPGLTPASYPTAAAGQYLVLINGNSPLLLAQVQQVQPSASLFTYQGRQLIQAGSFSDTQTAARQAQAIAAQGIAAEVVALPAGELPMTPAVEPVEADSEELVFAAEPDFDSYAAEDEAPLAASSGDRSRLYYIVIPTSAGELNRLSTQVAYLGQGYAAANVVEQREAPFGTHVRVGPFSDRDAALRWNRYFRDFGMNARLYFKR